MELLQDFYTFANQFKEYETEKVKDHFRRLYHCKPQGC